MNNQFAIKADIGAAALERPFLERRQPTTGQHCVCMSASRTIQFVANKYRLVQLTVCSVPIFCMPAEALYQTYTVKECNELGSLLRAVRPLNY